jgi:HEAT repeat protein
VDDVLAEGVRITEIKDDTEARAARRTLGFREVGTTEPRLVADGIVELRRLPGVTGLSDDEVAAVGRALAARAVPSGLRAELLRLVAARQWGRTLPGVRGALIDTPQVLNAALAARVALGAPADAAELKPYLDSKDPAGRASAVRALASLPDAPIDQIGRYATGDRDVDVRVTAIDALGATKKPAAVPTLTRTLAQSDRAIRQASGRALLAIGGDPVNDALIDLALHGPDPETQKYAAVLLVVANGKDSAVVKRLIAAKPSGDVRDVVEHGLEWQHTHQTP